MSHLIQGLTRLTGVLFQGEDQVVLGASKQQFCFERVQEGSSFP